MAKLTSIPSELLRLIFRETYHAKGDGENLALFNLSYVNAVFETISLEVYHNQSSIRWSEAEFQQRIEAFRKEEARCVLNNHVGCAACKGFDYETIMLALEEKDKFKRDGSVAEEVMQRYRKHSSPWETFATLPLPTIDLQAFKWGLPVPVSNKEVSVSSRVQ